VLIEACAFDYCSAGFLHPGIYTGYGGSIYLETPPEPKPPPQSPLEKPDVKFKEINFTNCEAKYGGNIFLNLNSYEFKDIVSDNSFDDVGVDLEVENVKKFYGKDRNEEITNILPYLFSVDTCGFIVIPGTFKNQGCIPIGIVDKCSLCEGLIEALESNGNNNVRDILLTTKADVDTIIYLGGKSYLIYSDNYEKKIFIFEDGVGSFQTTYTPIKLSSQFPNDSEEEENESEDEDHVVEFMNINFVLNLCFEKSVLFEIDGTEIKLEGCIVCGGEEYYFKTMKSIGNIKNGGKLGFKNCEIKNIKLNGSELILVEEGGILEIHVSNVNNVKVNGSEIIVILNEEIRDSVIHDFEMEKSGFVIGKGFSLIECDGCSFYSVKRNEGNGSVFSCEYESEKKMKLNENIFTDCRSGTNGGAIFINISGNVGEKGFSMGNNTFNNCKSKKEGGGI
jgi:hypothetical protein